MTILSQNITRHTSTYQPGAMKNHEVYTKEPIDREDENFLEERKELIEELFEKIEGYIKTNVSLLKLRALNTSSKIISALLANLVQLLLLFLFMLMLSVGMAVWLGSVIGKMHIGFLLIAGFYILLSIVYFIFFKDRISKYVSDHIIADIEK